MPCSFSVLTRSWADVICAPIGTPSVPLAVRKTSPFTPATAPVSFVIAPTDCFAVTLP